MDLLTVVITVALWIVGLLILAAVIRYAVRKGLEDLLFRKGKDGLWEANPDLVSVVKEINRKTRD